MTTDQDQSRDSQRSGATPRGQCAGCGATLVEDQRYCLRCGARRGKPRIDFTAFWGPLPPTDVHGERSTAHGERSTAQRVAGARGWLAAVLAASVLAAGIVAGIALGPGPASSPANSSTLARRALAALVARTGSDSRTSATTNTAPATPPSVSEASSPTSADKAARAAASSKASGSAAGGSSSNGSSSGGPAESPPSESSSSEGASSNGAPKEGSSKPPKGSGRGKSEKTTTAPVRLPPIQHVWLIVLGGSSFAAAAATPSAYPYLAGRLLAQGTLLTSYTALDAYELAGDATLLPGGVGASLDVISEPTCDTVPTAQAPTSQAPTTQAPTTQAPTTQAPTVQAAPAQAVPGQAVPAATSCPEGAQPSASEADAFLQRVTTPILSSPAYQEDGLIFITFAPGSSISGITATTLTLQPVAGALLLSPLLHGAARSTSPFNSLSPRTSLESIFGN